METEQIASFRGGFVFLTGDQSAFVNIPPDPGLTNGRIADTDGGQASGTIDGASWYLPLHVVHGNFRNTLNGIGMHPESISGFDIHDEPLLPVPGEISGFDMYFPHSGEKYDRLGKDIVASTDFYIWEFEVNKYGESGDITIQWDNTGFGNNEYNLILLDETNDRLIDMRGQDQYRVAVSGVKRFRIYYGTEKNLSEQVLTNKMQVGDIYPNPFESELFIPVSLPDREGTYRVEVSLSDLEGNRVAEFPPMDLSAGHHRFRCHGLETQPYRKGFYIVRIVISSKAEREIIYRKVLKF
jgi:hypothetical protein